MGAGEPDGTGVAVGGALGMAGSGLGAGLVDGVEVRETLAVAVSVGGGVPLAATLAASLGDDVAGGAGDGGDGVGCGARVVPGDVVAGTADVQPATASIATPAMNRFKFPSVV